MATDAAGDARVFHRLRVPVTGSRPASQNAEPETHALYNGISANTWLMPIGVVTRRRSTGSEVSAARIHEECRRAVAERARSAGLMLGQRPYVTSRRKGEEMPSRIQGVHLGPNNNHNKDKTNSKDSVRGHRRESRKVPVEKLRVRPAVNFSDPAIPLYRKTEAERIQNELRAVKRLRPKTAPPVLPKKELLHENLTIVKMKGSLEDRKVRSMRSDSPTEKHLSGDEFVEIFLNEADVGHFTSAKDMSAAYQAYLMSLPSASEALHVNTPNETRLSSAVSRRSWARSPKLTIQEVGHVPGSIPSGVPGGVLSGIPGVPGSLPDNVPVGVSGGISSGTSRKRSARHRFQSPDRATERPRSSLRPLIGSSNEDDLHGCTSCTHRCRQCFSACLASQDYLEKDPDSTTNTKQRTEKKASDTKPSSARPTWGVKSGRRRLKAIVKDHPEGEADGLLGLSIRFFSPGLGSHDESLDDLPLLDRGASTDFPDLPGSGADAQIKVTRASKKGIIRSIGHIAKAMSSANRVHADANMNSLRVRGASLKEHEEDEEETWDEETAPQKRRWNFFHVRTFQRPGILAPLPTFEVQQGLGHLTIHGSPKPQHHRQDMPLEAASVD